MMMFTLTRAMIAAASIAAFVVVNGDVNETAPYGLAFYHGNTSLPESLCTEEFAQVRNYVYPAYSYEVVNDTNITNTEINILQIVYNSVVSNSSNGTRVRSLLRKVSGKSQNDIDNEEEERRLPIERKLQSWCYAQCDVKTRTWLILNGCGTECGISRRLNTNNGVVDSTLGKERELQTYNFSYSSLVGNRTNILPGLGDTAASQFYATIAVVIPSNNTCQELLFNMTYQIWSLIVTI